MNRMRDQYYGLTEIVAELERDADWDVRLDKLKFFDKNSSGALRRMLFIVHSPSVAFTKIAESYEKELEDIQFSEVSDHGIMDVNWENTVRDLYQCSDDRLIKLDVAAANVFYMLEDMQNTDAKLIRDIITGKCTQLSQYINEALIRAAFPDLLGKSKDEESTT